MGTRARLLIGLSLFGAVCVAVACGSDAPDDASSSSGASGSSSGTSGGSSGSFTTSGGPGDGSSGGSSSGSSGGSCTAPVDMYIVQDRSDSMGTDCNIGATTNSKWCHCVNALSGYFNSQGATGQAAALQFFPIGSSQTLCDFPQYGTPALPTAGAYTTLPSNSFDALLNSTNQAAGTPTQGAIEGIKAFTKANRRPGHVTIGILITDGDPTKCPIQDPTMLGQLLADHYTATKIRTYVIGMTGATDKNLEAMAKNAGGPSHAATIGTATGLCGSTPEPCFHWNVGDGNPAVFEAALAAIQESADGCKDGGGYINPVN